MSNPRHSDDQYPTENQNILLEYLFNHKKILIVEVLKQYQMELPLVRTKSFLRKHIEFLLDIGTIDLNDVVAVLTEVEGWGRQQIYLYKWNGGITLRDQWLDPEWVKHRFEQNGLSEIFNATRPITETHPSSLFTIQYPHNKGISALYGFRIEVHLKD